MAQMLECWEINWYCLQEPGYYKDNDFGIRIEDIAVIVPVHTKVDTEWKQRFIDNLNSCEWFPVAIGRYKNCQGKFFTNVLFFPSAW